MDTFFIEDNNELEIKTNIELCEKMIKLFLLDYIKSYYPRRWADIQKLQQIPKKILKTTSIIYIPETKAELMVERGGKRYSIKLAIGDNKNELKNNFAVNPNLSETDNAALLKEINELRVTLSNMAVWAFSMINNGWEIPVDLTLKLHPDGAIHFESNGDPSVIMHCRKSEKFLYAKLDIF